MDMIRFCMAMSACILAPVIISIIHDRCGVRKKAADILLAGFGLVALPILTYSNLALFGEIINLNEDLSKEELEKPRESTFLAIMFFIVAFMIISSALVFTLSSCCYCCCFAAWIQAVKSYRRNPNGEQNHEQVIDPNLDPADRAAIEAALRDLDRAIELPNLENNANL